MAIISVIGTSGVGKSFLVKHLASSTSCPAFFEGEEGSIPKEIFNDVFSGKSPINRWTFFLDRYKKNLERANSISKLGMDCYVDGSALSLRAILSFEKEEYKDELLTLSTKFKLINSDINILLTANEKKLTEFINQRSRSYEPLETTLSRSIMIQVAFIAIAKNNNKIILIDRSDMDFSNPNDIDKILKLIKKYEQT